MDLLKCTDEVIIMALAETTMQSSRFLERPLLLYHCHSNKLLSTRHWGPMYVYFVCTNFGSVGWMSIWKRANFYSLNCPFKVTGWAFPKNFPSRNPILGLLPLQGFKTKTQNELWLSLVPNNSADSSCICRNILIIGQSVFSVKDDLYVDWTKARGIGRVRE